MSDLAFILPYEELSKTTNNITKQFNEEIIVETALLNKAIQCAKKLDKENIKVIVARGGTALILEKVNLNCEILELKITEYDLISSLLSAKKFGDCIGFVGFENMYRRIEEIAKLLNIKLYKKIIKNEEETPQLLDEIKNEVDVVIGGVITSRWAKKKQMDYVLIETTKKTIKNTIEEALKMIEVIKYEENKRTEIKKILNLIDQGIIAINKEGKINYVNDIAAKIYDLNANKIIGKDVKNASDDIELKRVLLSGEREKDQICKVNEKLYNITRVPVINKGEIIGAIKLIRDISEIEEIESKARKKIYAKGHYARYHFSDIIGESPEIKKVLKQAKKYSKVNANLLIYGETGTGKEMFAQSIHNSSKRSKQPFIAVNCAVLPEKLLESELFGYADGAFTGAKKGGKKGLFELAHRGTIFLDEITEMAPELQSRLLRVLQENRVRKIGGEQFIPVDIRIIASTNKNINKLINNNKFREDLYYRINILSLKLPALRNRRKDINLYASYFLNEFIKEYNKKGMFFSNDSLNVLNNYKWPGNIREFKNIIERCVILSDDNKINGKMIKDILDISEKKLETTFSNSIHEEVDKLVPKYNLKEIINKVETEIIMNAINEYNGNKTKAAKKLGIDRSTLWRKLKE